MIYAVWYTSKLKNGGNAEEGCSKLDEAPILANKLIPVYKTKEVQEQETNS